MSEVPTPTHESRLHMSPSLRPLGETALEGAAHEPGAIPERPSRLSGDLARRSAGVPESGGVTTPSLPLSPPERPASRLKGSLALGANRDEQTTSSSVPGPVSGDKRGRLGGDLAERARIVSGSRDKDRRVSAPSTEASPSRLSGDLARGAGSNAPMSYLRKLTEKKGPYTWGKLLSGETPLSEGGVELDTKYCMRAAGVENDSRAMSFGGAVKGPNYRELDATRPTERYKFYHSFADRTRGTAYLTELIERASEQGLSMTMKTMDHAYDGANVYTYHPDKMAALVREVYPKYQDAFFSTEHFLQGPIDGVDPAHIGWVQEPKASQGSHSSRMGRLGAVLDTEGLNESAYQAGCEVAGVRPDQPWLLNDASLEQVAHTVAAR